jgi:hypothetical protein
MHNIIFIFCNFAMNENNDPTSGLLEKMVESKCFHDLISNYVVIIFSFHTCSLERSRSRSDIFKSFIIKLDPVGLVQLFQKNLMLIALLTVATHGQMC